MPKHVQPAPASAAEEQVFGVGSFLLESMPTHSGLWTTSGASTYFSDTPSTCNRSIAACGRGTEFPVLPCRPRRAVRNQEDAMRLFSRNLAVALTMLALLTALPVQAAELTVSAAASLTNAFTELKSVFEQQHPGVTVHLNFAASNPLLKQIQEGAPVDVFASADQKTMDKAAESDCIVPASRKNFARNTLVLIVPKGAKLRPAAPEDLKKTEFAHIGVGSPASVPAGRYAKESLTNLALWDALQSKFIQGESVRQVLDYVARAEVDAGFVYATDAIKGKDKVDIVLTMPKHTPVEYPIARLKNAKNAKDADAFMALVLSAEGQKVLAKYGFTSPQ